MRILTRLAVLLTLLLVPACTRSNPSQVSVGLTAKAGPPPTSVPMTSLMVTITRVDVHLAAADDDTRGKHDEPPALGDDDGRWTTVFSGSARLDLIDAAATESFLGTAVVPPGRINQIRLILADDVTLVSGGVSLPVGCPSCTETGIKVVIGDHDDLLLVDGGHLHVVLDFDRGVSLIIDQNGVMLRPVIRIGETHEDDD